MYNSCFLIFKAEGRKEINRLIATKSMSYSVRLKEKKNMKHGIWEASVVSKCQNVISATDQVQRKRGNK
jgi:hypothetical protein